MDNLTEVLKRLTRTYFSEKDVLADQERIVVGILNEKKEFAYFKDIYGLYDPVKKLCLEGIRAGIYSFMQKNSIADLCAVFNNHFSKFYYDCTVYEEIYKRIKDDRFLKERLRKTSPFDVFSFVADVVSHEYVNEIKNKKKEQDLKDPDNPLIKILGTDLMPHKPTELECFAEEIAEKEGIFASITDNGLAYTGWMYYYSKKGTYKNRCAAYELYCFTGKEGGPKVPFERAKRRFIKSLKIRRFEESFAFFRRNCLVLHIMYSHILKLEPDQYHVYSGKYSGKFSLNQIRLLILPI